MTPGKDTLSPDTVIAFIGGGNMATALIGGLYAAGADHAPGTDLAGSVSRPYVRVADPNGEARNRMIKDFGVVATPDGAAAAAGADLVVLAVKPQLVQAALDGLGKQLTPQQTLVSVAAGTTIATLQGLIADGVPVVRTMPNTPALLGLGMTGLFADARCTRRDRDRAESLMGVCGATVWVDEEDQMNLVTAVSGSGPAYYYLFTEALAEAATALGLPRETALRLARQTALGAGAMAARDETDIVELRRRVTSPGGTTQAAIEALEADALRAIVARAVDAATRRGRALAGTESGADA
ncbi:MAG: pyrroline-5-carboxylate reductase [Pseudomonadota bacterium]